MDHPTHNLEAFSRLKQNAGTHSPSMSMLKRQFPELSNQLVDACFIRNPYATDLFLSRLKEDLKDYDFLEGLISYYPMQNGDVAKLIARAEKLDPETIFVGNGAAEAIHAVIQHFCGEKIVVNLPTFSPYYEFSEPHLEVTYYPLDEKNDFKLNIQDYIRFVKTQKADSVVLINPNNPDGSYIRCKDIETIVDELQDLSSVIIDESFIHFAYENEPLDPISNKWLTEKYPNVVLIKSMSKDFGIAGLRAGYAVMAPDRVAALLKSGYLWNSNGFAEYFFTLWSEPAFRDAYEIRRKSYIGMIQDFYHQMKAIESIKIHPSSSNFFLVRLNRQSAEQFALHLLFDHQVYVRACTDKLGLKGEYLRVNVCREEENKLIIQAFKEATIKEFK